MDFKLGARNFGLLCRCLILNTGIMIILRELSLLLKFFFFFLIFSSINLETMNFKEFFVRYENVLAFYSFLKMKSKQIIKNDQEKN